MLETYNGYVETGHDALLLFEACRRGLLQRVPRRLSEKERATITSGSIFVWDEEESGMRRWTDGKSWSASRVLGCFLTYQEQEPRRRNTQSGRSPTVSPVLARSNSSGPSSTPSQQTPTALKPTASATDSSPKEGGLVKKSLSLTTADNHKLHLICYYAKQDVQERRLMSPTYDPMLANLTIPHGFYPEMMPETSTPQDQWTPTPIPSVMDGRLDPYGRPIYPPSAYMAHVPPPSYALRTEGGWPSRPRPTTPSGFNSLKHPSSLAGTSPAYHPYARDRSALEGAYPSPVSYKGSPLPPLSSSLPRIPALDTLSAKRHAAAGLLGSPEDSNSSSQSLLPSPTRMAMRQVPGSPHSSASPFSDQSTSPKLPSLGHGAFHGHSEDQRQLAALRSVMTL
ncbi:Gluconate transport-inducing protein [Dimargaris verticillata]|uniref:Gluconate transport-inducing protein n=1 Tax=Dimargaris verticillata TaxID=2761393 RepID=A0A9W8E7Z4_9FUNG|nr:Gluconate transport-inducing protein [Dimargaris verticillata]